MHKKKVVFTFRCNGEELLLDGKEFGILDYDGIEATDYDLAVERNINAMGGRLKKKSILPRPIDIEFEYRGRDKVETRQRLIRFFSPLQTGTLIVNYLGVERQIEYEVSTAPKFANKNIHQPLKCLVELECMDPPFKDSIEESEIISTWVGGWSFPFTFPFSLKRRGATKTNILNGGHMETPVMVEFHGPAKNPYIKNISTGKYLQIEAILSENQTLYIDTAFRKKTVEIEENGVRIDAAQLLSFDSRFWNLQVGDNMVQYGSDDDTQDNNVVIRYRNRYWGV